MSMQIFSFDKLTVAKCVFVKLLPLIFKAISPNSAIFYYFANVFLELEMLHGCTSAFPLKKGGM
jgi:hypothetical protein